MQQLLHQHLLRAQKHMKEQADKNRTDRTFELGEYVYLKVKPYVQTSLAARSSNNLSFRYFGPYQIIDKIGEVAYKLKLPDGCTVHPVFHVLLLKKAVHHSTLVCSEIPDLSHELQVPQFILDRRLHQQQDKMIPQVLIQWSHWPLDTTKGRLA
ncbi:hypothetical protein SEVIR_1G109033v4 [Setaria viridis]